MKKILFSMLSLYSTIAFSQVVGTTTSTYSEIWKKSGELKQDLIFEGRSSIAIYQKYNLIGPKGLNCVAIVAGHPKGTSTRTIPKGTRFNVSYLGAANGLILEEQSLGLSNGVWKTKIIPVEATEVFHLIPENSQELGFKTGLEDNMLVMKCSSNAVYKPVVISSNADTGLSVESSDECQTYTSSERVWAYRQDVTYYACRNFDNYIDRYSKNQEIAAIARKRVLEEKQLRSFIDSYIE